MQSVTRLKNECRELEDRLGETDKAVQVYKQGMEQAMKAGDNHAYGELRGAYEELTF